MTVNLTDPVFRGLYHGRKKHDGWCLILLNTYTYKLLASPKDDFQAMLERSRTAGVSSMIITGSSLHESRQALELAKEHGRFHIMLLISHFLPHTFKGMYATIGCHPTRSKEFDQYNGGPAAYLRALEELVKSHIEGKGRAVAIGECGLGLCFSLLSLQTYVLTMHNLDYDRTHFSPPDTQKTHFRQCTLITRSFFSLILSLFRFTARLGKEIPPPVVSSLPRCTPRFCQNSSRRRIWRKRGPSSRRKGGRCPQLYRDDRRGHRIGMSSAACLIFVLTVFLRWTWDFTSGW